MDFWATFLGPGRWHYGSPGPWLEPLQVARFLLSVQSAGVASTLRGPRSITPQISMPDLLLLPLQLHHRKAVAGGKERNAYNVQEHCAKSEDAPASFTPPPLRLSADSQYAMHAGKAQHRATSLCSASARRAAFGSAYHMAFSAKAGHSHYGYDHPVPTRVQRSDTKMSLLLSKSFKTFFF